MVTSRSRTSKHAPKPRGAACDSLPTAKCVSFATEYDKIVLGMPEMIEKAGGGEIPIEIDTPLPLPPALEHLTRTYPMVRIWLVIREAEKASEPSLLTESGRDPFTLGKLILTRYRAHIHGIILRNETLPALPQSASERDKQRRKSEIMLAAEALEAYRYVMSRMMSDLPIRTALDELTASKEQMISSGSKC